MTHNLAKIRAALEQEPGASRGQALAALAELERAAKEPVGWQWLNTCHYRRYLPDAAEQPEWRPLYTTPPPAQPAPKFEAPEVDDAICARIGQIALSLVASPKTTHIENGRNMIAAVRSELGPTLGLVTREPINEGKLWSLIRNVLQQGVDIHIDHCGLGYEKYSARLDAAAAERVVDFVNLCNAQKTEK